MMLEVGPERYEATCETCKTTRTIEALRELAVLRLMRDGWRVRTQLGETSTWCPSCRPITSPGIDRR